LALCRGVEQSSVAQEPSENLKTRADANQYLTVNVSVSTFPVALRPKAGREGLEITNNDAPQVVGLLWAFDKLVPETST
jgi:hypothetical protein